MRAIPFVLIILLVATKSLAQSKNENKDTTSLASFASFGIRYKSDNYYMGRSDSAKAPYLIPTLGYYHKSGFFVSSSLSYLTLKHQSRVDLYTLSAGYDYFGQKLITGISIDQYFFSDLSYSVQAEMRSYASAYLGYDFRYFMIQTDASLGLSKKLDVFLGTEISHTFYLFKNKLLVSPSVSANFGTQKYYNEYYTERSITTGSGEEEGAVAPGSNTDPGNGTGDPGSGQGPGGPGSGQGPGRKGDTGGRISTTLSTSQSVITEVKVLESEKFQVLDYEAGLFASYKLRQFRFTLSGRLLFPVNPSTIETDQFIYEEKLKTGFYWTAGIRYILE